MDNYKSNSHRSKEKGSGEERQKLEKVISGTAKVKPKSKTRKFADVFISEDASNVKNYIFSDVLIPAVKKLVSDIVKDGIEMILYGGTSGRDRRSNGSRASYVSYDRFSDRRDTRRDDYRARNGYGYDDVTLDTRSEAEEVLTRMDELIDMYGMVRVADLYDLVGISGNYTDNKYGWTNIRNASVVRDRDGGYRLKLPRALPID